MIKVNRNAVQSEYHPCTKPAQFDELLDGDWGNNDSLNVEDLAAPLVADEVN